jgi:8-oxo-dGTP diphosphatase
MPSDRFRLPAAVYAVLEQDEQVLLMRRSGSGYRDGQLSLPAGHLDEGEDVRSALAREVREELGVEVSDPDARLEVVLHSRAEFHDDSDYLHLFFRVTRWRGSPAIREPDKCTELRWTDPGRLPADTVDYVVQALDALRQRQSLVVFGW